VRKCEHCEDVNYFVAYWKDRPEHESEGGGRCKVREAAEKSGRQARGKIQNSKIRLSPKSHAHVITTTSLA